LPPAAAEERVGPLERGLAVLRAMAVAPGPRMRPSDLAQVTGLARSTVDRITTTLTHLGLVRTEGRDVLLAPRLMELGSAYLTGCGLPGPLEPLAHALAGELDESVSVAVPDEDGARFIVQTARRRTLSLAFRIGDLLPAERCAAGAVLATEWGPEQYGVLRDRETATSRFAVPPRPDAGFRARVAAAAEVGWSVDDQLIEPCLIAIAVPVRDEYGRIRCVVSVVSHTSRHTVETLRLQILPRLLKTAAEMETALRLAPAAFIPSDDPSAREAHRLAKQELGPEFLQSLARGLAVLTALGSGSGLTLSAVAEATELPRATVRRALLTLRELGYAGSDGRLFHLRPKVLELGHARLSALTFVDLVQPHLARLVDRVHQSASLAVLAGDDILYVARVQTSRIMRVSIAVGTRLPAYATSLGRVLLAGLPERERAAYLARVEPESFTGRTTLSIPGLSQALDAAASMGHAVVDQELEEGVRSIAVPIRDRHGTVLAAMNVAMHAGRGTPEDMRRDILPVLAETATDIEADLAAASARGPLSIP
jgi:IclR family transcriptional regulator, pca regulon regulatory protein